MNDPASPLTRAQDAINSNIQEIFFSSATWKHAVEFYEKLTGVSPNPAGPPTAVFQSKLGYEIRVTQTDDKNTLAEQTNNSIFFFPVGNPQDVGSAIDAARSFGAMVIIRSITMDVFPVVEPPMLRRLTMGMARFQTGQQATSDDTTVGAIHNPNW
ncbi:hypothetical protein D0N36_13095 [Hymenobacter lapidiphilus]|uniref:hypothetical protein n=1 Tax=Hymenobacter sp. CCM 8763 TaxID=2303334 RepID=UPI000E3453EF|nr:hypothetical protein [Hymenobacter sp. CCM 8763]RFP64693.1 hypothetical protein D0N36_13095 [Hymenobacter sp. CCM 8763]